tara:strand:+ start:566 stop:1123 length:558 start_codon:yes stop_codon:yes gene_type:complete
MGNAGEYIPRKQSGGSGTAPIGVTINTAAAFHRLAEITQTMEHFKKMKKDEIRAINKSVAIAGVRSARRQVKDFGRDITVSGRSTKKGDPIIIKPGTLRRSIQAIAPGDGTNYWMGVRSSTLQGKGVYNQSDGWFGHIVHGGDSYFGAGKNRGFWDRSSKAARKTMEAKMIKEYNKFLEQYIKAL